MSRVRNFCFTSHVGPIEFSDDMTYLIQGEEIGKETNKEHIQGFVIFKNPRMLSGVIKKYKGVHWEVCKGTPLENVEYCKKEGKFTEWGTAPKAQGARTDVVKLGELVKKGLSDREICEFVDVDEEGNEKEFCGTWIRNYKGIREARKVLHPVARRNWVMDVRIYWGPSGSGKTRKVWDEFSDIYVKPVGRWWDGYEGQEVVLIDDFDPNNCFDIQFDFYLKLLDRYPMSVEVKGGFVEFTSKRVIFTSNHGPDTWFVNKSNRAAFFRRISEVVFLGEKGAHAHAQRLGGGNTEPLPQDPLAPLGVRSQGCEFAEELRWNVVPQSPPLPPRPGGMQ
jgi:hypothetical protein